jgi:hypothetical protein
VVIEGVSFGDVEFRGVRGRIENCTFDGKVELFDSTISLTNCNLSVPPNSYFSDGNRRLTGSGIEDVDGED